MKLSKLFLLLFATVVLVAPSAINIIDSVLTHDWRLSPRFDGEAYLVSASTGAEGDQAGTSALLTTLLAWQGVTVSQPEVEAALSGREPTLSDFALAASDLGVEGQWYEADRAALRHLDLPAIAHLTGGNHAGLLIVRDSRGGYIYATSPGKGNLLFPETRFEELSSGHVFVFDEGLTQPEEWR